MALRRTELTDSYCMYQSGSGGRFSNSKVFRRRLMMFIIIRQI